MARKKLEGIEALVSKEDPVSIQEITMLDWYASFASMGAGLEGNNEKVASMAFDRAEAMMKEREKRL
jgi:hypothetical protein